MKIPLRELEEARRDIGAYLQRKRSEGSGSYGRSKYLTLQRAIHVFHRSNNNIETAQEYLEESFKKFKRPAEFARYIELLEQYSEEFKILGTTVFRVKDRLLVPLTQEFVNAGVRISGEIPRVDLTDTGYTAWVFSKNAVGLEDELRLPIIKAAYAVELGAEEDEIEIGVYDFSKGEHKLFNFSQTDINAAIDELNRLVSRALKLNQAGGMNI
jgi:hypothetical protein